MKPIDPLQLQRLVDGELDPSQIQQVLSQAQAAPQQWQEIAVGFVENQLWNGAFQSDHGSSLPPELLPTENSKHMAGGGLTPGAGTAPIQKQTTATIRPRSGYSWLNLAASLLAAAAIGYMANQIQNRNLPSTEIAEAPSTPESEQLIAESSPEAAPMASKITPASLQPDYHLQVPEDNEYLRDVVSAGPVAPVPLYRIGNAEQLKLLNEQRERTALPPEILQRLSGSGYQMQQEIKFISGRLGDGRSFVVPVRTIRFLPGQ